MRTTFLYTFCIVAGISVVAQDTSAQSEEQPIASWIDRLESDSYVTRTLGRRLLLDAALNDEGLSKDVIESLRHHARVSESLEVRHTCRSLLAELRRIEFQDTVTAFLYDPDFAEDRLPGWGVFAQVAGNDRHARRLFTEVLARDANFVRALENRGYRDLSRVAEVDLRRDDAVGWSMLLAAASQTPNVLPSDVVFRVNAALRCEGTGPMHDTDWRSRVLIRMIANYLEHSSMDVRDKISIGIRYQCGRTVEACEQVLANPVETASRTVTALLALSKLKPDDEQTDSIVRSFLDDSRTSHVWRSMAVEKTTRRTQVRDVALALCLHRTGVDPRSVGFDTLQADPILVFRAYTLGFESNKAREACRRNANIRLIATSRRRDSD